MGEAQEAIAALEELGLTEYEARCFVALAQLPHGTAKEIGQVADIPRSRVYETMDRLRKKGLIEIHETEPRMYQSVSTDTAIQILRKEYESYFDTAERTLEQLEPAYKDAQQGCGRSIPTSKSPGESSTSSPMRATRSCCWCWRKTCWTRPPPTPWRTSVTATSPFTSEPSPSRPAITSRAWRSTRQSSPPA